MRRLRKETTGLKQEQFALMGKISRRSLRQLERGEGNPTLATLNAVFVLWHAGWIGAQTGS